MNPAKTAIVYVRVSTEKQASKGVSLDAQVSACRPVGRRFVESREVLYQEPTRSMKAPYLRSTESKL